MDEVDIYAGLSGDELFEGFGEGTEANAVSDADETEDEEEVVEEEPEDQADQSDDGEESEEEQAEEEPVAEEKPSDQTFTLKHLGETKDYSREEVIPLA